MAPDRFLPEPPDSPSYPQAATGADILADALADVDLGSVLAPSFVPSTRTVSPGSNLTGGGALSGNISLALSPNPSVTTLLASGLITSGAGFQVVVGSTVVYSVDSSGAVTVGSLVVNGTMNITLVTATTVVTEDATVTDTLTVASLSATEAAFFGSTVTVSSSVTAAAFIGDGSGLTNVAGTLSSLPSYASSRVTAAYATTGVLATNTYANGTAGVGATLTATGNGALSVDGTTVTTGLVILVKNESATAHNGLYVVTTVGDGSHPYVLTRHASMNQPAQFYGAVVAVMLGTTNTKTVWVQESSVFTIGTDGTSFVLFVSPTPALPGDLARTDLDNNFSVNQTMPSTITGSLTATTAGVTTLAVASSGTVGGSLTGINYAYYNGSYNTINFNTATISFTGAAGGNGNGSITALTFWGDGSNLTDLSSANMTFGNGTVPFAAVTAPPLTGTNNSVIKRSTSDYTNSSTTLASLTVLPEFSNIPPGSYIGRFVIKCNNTVAAEGAKFSFATGGTISVFWAAASVLSSSGTVTPGTVIITSTSGVINYTTMTGETVIAIDFFVTVTSTAGMELEAAENSHSSGTLTVEANTFAWLAQSQN